MSRSDGHLPFRPSRQAMTSRRTLRTFEPADHVFHCHPSGKREKSPDATHVSTQRWRKCEGGLRAGAGTIALQVRHGGMPQGRVSLRRWPRLVWAPRASALTPPDVRDSIRATDLLKTGCGGGRSSASLRARSGTGRSGPAQSIAWVHSHVVVQFPHSACQQIPA